ncbi:N-acetyltransferase [Aliigemmobacter aestuarii]|uniref:N-acetyltransferase n=1 Tax=Aliigemmobacter aestuarii TaxID=1445661 RepID=A0A4V3V0U7_9RHOB|nr:GNAT family N-acetyltransferase [Gemmobacter aestuarii]THD85332.1 N-acetyltransferase [Gemmobacter aestuarii]
MQDTANRQTADVRIAPGVLSLDPGEWDALACPEAANGGRPFDPFTTHRFLAALERSGSVGAGTGWQPQPLILHRDGRAVAAAPLYAKTHSQGEYIFDHGWAEAWMRAGGRYYPKLQVAVPFTPVTGRRFLGAAEDVRPLARALAGITERNGLSSAHVTFCTADEAAAVGGMDGYLHRVTQQYHWLNRGYDSFDAFLADLSSRKRKAIRKERETARAAGLDIRALTGDAIEPAHWDAFWAFYQDTGSRKWGRPYLTRAFFDEVHRTMRDDVLLVMAFRNGHPVAGALNFIGRDALYGRYWGALEHHPCLHFELCYHQAIDWAIAQGLDRVEAGAQGEHKLARGYMPAEIHSLHWIADAGFRRAVADYLAAERRAVAEDMEILTSMGPFRRAGGADEPPAA